MKPSNEQKRQMTHRAIHSYEDHLQNYEKTESNSLEGIAAQVAEKAVNEQVPMEKNPQVLKDLIGTDVRDAVPPQIYTVIADIVNLIEELERDDDNEGQ